MLNKDFYKIIDNELNELLTKHASYRYLETKKTTEQKKGYALLMWFLEFYARKNDYGNYITDGKDDASCDIVFDYTTHSGKKVFYIIQSKWNNENNAGKETERDEILKALSDFDTLLKGERKNLNERVSQKLEELQNHLRDNGEVKFIFLSLAQYQGKADENIKAFTKGDPKIAFEVIDLNRIKSDYIDRKYKEIEPLNPLESNESPEDTTIRLPIVRNGEESVIKIDRPFEAYTLLVRPKTLFELFDRYNFSLFFKNVRNPLLQSQFNEEIEKTIIDNTPFFWYYNNGVTAIAKILEPLGKTSTIFELTGLQIINGAQTVYSVYRAYRDASPTQRKQMDNEALITFRLLKSGGKEFDLNVTRYTNSQNPVTDRDFCANDDVQIALQNASFKTNVWYEKRRGEFRNVPEGVTVVSNEELAKIYLAYYLKDPNSLNSHYAEEQNGKKLIFVSEKEYFLGLYEKIFNENTNFQDMLAGYYVSQVIEEVLTKLKIANYGIETSELDFLDVINVVLSKYLRLKFSEEINISLMVIKMYENGDKKVIYGSIILAVEQVNDIYLSDTKTEIEKLRTFFLPQNRKYFLNSVESSVSIEAVESGFEYSIFNTNKNQSSTN